MKNRILFFLMAIILIVSCEKQEIVNNEIGITAKTQKQFYFQGNWYLLNYEDGVPNDSEAKSFIENLFSNNDNLIVDHIAGETNKVYITEEEKEFYELFSEKFTEGFSKKMILNISINQLKEDLILEFGDVYDNNNPDFLLTLKNEVTKICEKYKVKTPSNFSNFFKTEELYNPNQGVRRGWDICEVWAVKYFGGQAIPINPFDYGLSNTYGDWGCFQDITVSNLGNIPMVNGIQSHWDDIISSGYFRANEGADITIFTVYKDTNLNGFRQRFYTSNITDGIQGNAGGGTIYSVPNFNNYEWCWFVCSTLNNSISSMKATNYWQGCPL